MYISIIKKELIIHKHRKCVPFSLLASTPGAILHRTSSVARPGRRFRPLRSDSTRRTLRRREGATSRQLMTHPAAPVNRWWGTWCGGWRLCAAAAAGRAFRNVEYKLPCVDHGPALRWSMSSKTSAAVGREYAAYAKGSRVRIPTDGICALAVGL